MTKKEEEGQVTVWNDDKQISAQFAAAVELFRDGTIPESAKFKRQGPSGKFFTYIKHTWVTEQLTIAFGPMWSMEVLRETSYPEDHSATAIVRLITYHPDENGNIHQVHIDECGAFKDATKMMPQAYRIASAVSRGLVKCVMRRTRCGISLYNNEFQPTAAEAARTLFRSAKKNGITKERLIACYKEHDISSENLLEQYEEAYHLLYQLRQEKEAKEVAKFFETDTPSGAPASTTTPTTAAKKGDKLSKAQASLLNFMIKTLKIEVTERGFAARVAAVNERLEKREYGALDTLSDELCGTIVDRLQAASDATGESTNPQHGPLANETKCNALLSWAHDLAGMSEQTVLDVLNEALVSEEKSEVLGFEFVPYTLKEAQEKIQYWVDN